MNLLLALTVGLRNVRPSLSCDDARHLPATDSVLETHDALCLSSGYTLPHFTDSRFSQLGLRQLGAAWRYAAAAFVHVCHVVRWRPDIQVLNVDARPHIAVMQNTEPAWHRAVGKFPSGAVRRSQLSLVPYGSVTSSRYASGPQQAAALWAWLSSRVKSSLERSESKLPLVHCAVFIPTHDRTIS
jgi:hypothetical protein